MAATLQQAKQLMQEQGFIWSPVAGKQQLPGEYQPYYHIIHESNPKNVRKFHNLTDMVAYLRGQDADEVR